MEKSQFRPKKVKFLNNNALYVEYGDVEENEQIKVEKTFTGGIHEELSDLKMTLTRVLSAVHGYIPYDLLFKSQEEMSDAKARVVNEELMKTNVSSLSISFGPEGTMTFLLGGSRQVLPGRAVACNTPQISEEDADVKHITEINEVVLNVLDEVYEYVFNHKRSQVSVFDQEEDHKEID